jgi:hypothetical protein
MRGSPPALAVVRISTSEPAQQIDELADVVAHIVVGAGKVSVDVAHVCVPAAEIGTQAGAVDDRVV